MKSRRLFLAMAALLGASACECGTEPDCFLPGSGGAPSPDDAIVVAGQPATLRVVPTMAIDCGTGQTRQVADSASVEVYGPDNLPVPADVEFQSGGAAVVTFTPATTGRYHALVSFTPVGGVHQRDVFSALDRSGEEPLTRFGTSTAETCPSVERTPRGTWLCGGLAVRASGTPQVLGGELQVATAGDVVWTVDANQVKRYVDTGTELKLTGTLALAVGYGTTRLADPDELLVLVSSLVTRITFTEAEGLKMAETVRWQKDALVPSGPDGVMGIPIRAGTDRLLVVGTVRDVSTSALSTQACPLQRDAAGAWARTAESCQTLAGTPLGYEDGVLWTSTTSSTSTGTLEQAHRLEPQEGWLRETGSLSLGGQLGFHRAPLAGGPVTPLVLPFGFGIPRAVLRWDAARRELGLELLPVRESSQARASASYVWGTPVGGGGGTWVYARASTP